MTTVGAGLWSSHLSSKVTWQFPERFATFVAQQDPVPRELDELSAELVKRWRLSPAAGPQG